MSDKLKKFIQRSKTEFDHESPRPDLFDKIMDKVDHNKIGEKPKVNIKYAFQWMAIAASLLLLIVCSLFFYLSDNQIQNPTFQIVETPVPQIDNNNVRASNSEELAQSATSEQIIKDAANTLMSPSNSSAIQKLNRNSTNTATYGRLSIQNKEQENKQVEITIPSIVSTPVKRAEVELKNVDSAILPVDPQSSNQTIIAENNPQKENNTSDVVIVSTLPEFVKTESPNQIKEIEKTTSPSKDSETETISNEYEEESSSLKSSIKKGFFKFLSKKARKWSGNTLSIRNVETNDKSVLAVRYKNERVEFSKSFNLGPSN